MHCGTPTRTSHSSRAVQQAPKFGLFDLTRLEHLVLKHVAGDFFALASDDQGSDDDDPA